MIQERINKLKPYFKGLKVAENYRIVEFNLKNSWVVEESLGIELQQKNIKENFAYSFFKSGLINSVNLCKLLILSL